jgi:hypothetical protein
LRRCPVTVHFSPPGQWLTESQELGIALVLHCASSILSVKTCLKKTWSLYLKSYSYSHCRVLKILSLQYTTVINYHQWSSIIFNSHQFSSILTNSHQFASIRINSHQFSSILINSHQFSSIIINYHQLSSILINYHQL